jgi:hypothetical protein
MFLLLAVYLSLIGLSSSQELRGSSLDQQLQSVVCRITVVDTMYAVPNSAPAKKEHLSCIPIVNDEETDDVFPVVLPQDFVSAHELEIEQGRLFVSILGATLSDEGLSLAENAQFSVLESVPEHLRYLQDATFTIGTRTIAVVRVSTTDSTPTFTANQLENGLFGDGINMKTQYDACSFGQLKWQLAEAGVMDINVGQPVSNFIDYAALVTAAQKKMKADMGISTVTVLADKVIFCLPPGTGNWVASAGVGHFRAQFNNDWCLSLTATMHEIGHTVGLAHSNENGVAYTDTTGYMAYGHKETSWPQKCFNGHKNWLLGWYSTRHLTLNPVQDGSRLFKLATFVDYDKTGSDDKVVINIGDVYFLQYNRAKSFNVHTEEKKDMVTVTEDAAGGSENRAGLSVGERYEVSNFQNSGKTLVVEVCEMMSGSNSSPDAMVVSVGMGGSMCGQQLSQAQQLSQGKPTPRPTHSPTRKPTVAPTSKPVESCAAKYDSCSANTCCGSLKCTQSKRRWWRWRCRE